MLLQELEHTSATLAAMDVSHERLQKTNKQYQSQNPLFAASRRLLSTMKRHELLDSLVLYLGLGFFLLVVFYILQKRSLYFMPSIWSSKNATAVSTAPGPTPGPASGGQEAWQRDPGSNLKLEGEGKASMPVPTPAPDAAGQAATRSWEEAQFGAGAGDAVLPAGGPVPGDVPASVAATGSHPGDPPAVGVGSPQNEVPAAGGPVPGDVDDSAGPADGGAHSAEAEDAGPAAAEQEVEGADDVAVAAGWPPEEPEDAAVPPSGSPEPAADADAASNGSSTVGPSEVPEVASELAASAEGVSVPEGGAEPLAASPGTEPQPATGLGEVAAAGPEALPPGQGTEPQPEAVPTPEPELEPVKDTWVEPPVPHALLEAAEPDTDGPRESAVESQEAEVEGEKAEKDSEPLPVPEEEKEPLVDGSGVGGPERDGAQGVGGADQGVPEKGSETPERVLQEGSIPSHLMQEQFSGGEDGDGAGVLEGEGVETRNETLGDVEGAQNSVENRTVAVPNASSGGFESGHEKRESVDPQQAEQEKASDQHPLSGWEVPDGAELGSDDEVIKPVGGENRGSGGQRPEGGSPVGLGKDAEVEEGEYSGDVDASYIDDYGPGPAQPEAEVPKESAVNATPPLKDEL